MSGVAGVLADVIEQRAEEVYPRDVFIPPTRETFDEVNALLRRERGHMLDGIAAECYRRAYASIAEQVRRGDIDLEAAVLAWIGERLADEGLREAVGAAENEVIVTHSMWIGDDGKPLDYLPVREAQISDYLHEAAGAALAAVGDALGVER